jgi:hypothetical protein
MLQLTNQRSLPMSTMPSPDDSVAALIIQFQEKTGATDDQIATAIGYESGRVIAMITAGRMKLPLNKVKPLADAIGIEAPRLLRLVLEEGSPELLAALDSIFPQMKFDSAEVKLLETLRKLARDRKWAPIVFDGQAVVALIAL